MKTVCLNPQEVDTKWLVIDAKDQILGRLASQIVHLLRGKHKPEFAPNAVNGDCIIVVNCAKIKVTGTKMHDKRYYRHSGWVGGIKSTSLQVMFDKSPMSVLQTAVRGMLPRNKLRQVMLKRLKLYAGAEHPHAAQNPQTFQLPY